MHNRCISLVQLPAGSLQCRSHVSLACKSSFPDPRTLVPSGQRLVPADPTARPCPFGPCFGSSPISHSDPPFPFPSLFVQFVPPKQNHHQKSLVWIFHLVSPPSGRRPRRPRRGDSKSLVLFNRRWDYWATAGISRGVELRRESCRGQRSDARAAVCQLETASFAAKHDRAPSPCYRRPRSRASRPLLSPSCLRHRLATSRSSPRGRHAVERGPSTGHGARSSCQEENGPPLPSGGCCAWCYGPRLHLALGLDTMPGFQFRVDFN